MKSYSKFLKNTAHFQVEHPYITLSMVLLITLTLYGGVSSVKTVASLESMMPNDVEEIKAFNVLRDNGLGKDMIGVVIELNSETTDISAPLDIRDKNNLEYIDGLTRLLRREHDILDVYSASDVILFAAQKKDSRIKKIEDISENFYLRLLENEELQKELSNFIDEEYSTSIIIATTDVSANDPRMKLLAEKMDQDIESIGKPSSINIKLTGTPIIQQKLGVLIGQDRKNTQLISTIFVFLITVILFGSVSSALVPIIVVTLSVNWLYGIMGYTNLPISTLAGGVAAMVIGIGIDYSIHLMNKFKNERKKGNTIEDSIEKAVSETGTALTGAAIATILAFLAFLMGSMPEMNRFGLLMAVGVGSAFLLSIFGLPALLIIEEKIIHLIAKRGQFGVDGELSLYERDKIHPESHEEIDPEGKDVRELLKKYKVCKKKGGKK